MVLAIAVTVFYFLNPRSITYLGMTLILQTTGILGIVAIGQTIVLIGGSQGKAIGVDISVGSLIFVTTVIACGLTLYDVPQTVVIILCCLWALMIGSMNGLLVAKGKLHPIIVTFAMFMVLRGLSYTLRYVTPAGDVIRFMGAGRVFGIPVPFLFFLSLMFLFVFIFNRVVFGRRLFAKSSNPLAARLVGVKTEKYTFLSYVICSLLTGIAALCYYGYVGQPTLEYTDMYTFESMAAAILGGTGFGTGEGTVLGTLAGVFFIRFLFNLLHAYGFGDPLRKIVQGAIVITVVVGYSLIAERRRA